MRAILLAAGYATRLYPDTKDLPKALLNIGGETMLDRIIEKIDTLGSITEIHVISNHRFAQQLEHWAKQKARSDLFVWDDGTTDNDNRLGAIGDMQFVLERVGYDDDWFIAASDNLFDFELEEIEAVFKRTGCPTLCGMRIEQREKLHALAVAELAPDGRVITIEEKPANPRSDIGVYALYFYPHQDMLRVQEYLNDPNNSKDAPGYFAAWLHRQGPVYCHIASGHIYDVGTHDELRRVRTLFEPENK